MKLTRKNQNKNLGCITMYSAESNAYNNYQACQNLGGSGCGDLPYGFHFPEIKLPSFTTGAAVGGAVIAQTAMQQALNALNK